MTAGQREPTARGPGRAPAPTGFCAPAPSLPLFSGGSVASGSACDGTCEWQATNCRGSAGAPCTRPAAARPARGSTGRSGNRSCIDVGDASGGRVRGWHTPTLLVVVLVRVCIKVELPAGARAEHKEVVRRLACTAERVSGRPFKAPACASRCTNGEVIDEVIKQRRHGVRVDLHDRIGAELDGGAVVALVVHDCPHAIRWARSLVALLASDLAE